MLPSQEVWGDVQLRKQQLEMSEMPTLLEWSGGKWEMQ